MSTQKCKAPRRNKSIGESDAGEECVMTLHNLRMIQGSNGPDELRSNDRPLTLCFTIRCRDVERADAVVAALLGKGHADAFLELEYSLLYENGSEAQLNRKGPYGDNLSLREPSGKQVTVRRIHQSAFVLSSHGDVENERVPEGIPIKRTGVRHFLVDKYIDAEKIEQNGLHFDVCLKIGTNLTSKQHDGRRFRWKVKMTCGVGGMFTGEVQSHAFEYVARQPLNGNAARKRKAAVVSDDEDDMFDEEAEDTDSPDGWDARALPTVTRRSTRARRCVEYRDPESDEDGPRVPVAASLAGPLKSRRTVHRKCEVKKEDLPRRDHENDDAMFKDDGALGSLYADGDEGEWGSLDFLSGAGTDFRFFEFLLDSENVSPEEYCGMIAWIA